MGFLIFVFYGKGRLVLLILGNFVEGLMDVVFLVTFIILLMIRLSVGIRVDK